MFSIEQVKGMLAKAQTPEERGRIYQLLISVEAWNDAKAIPREEAERRADELMLKLREYLSIYHVFYGALLHNLKLKRDWRAKTLYTDAIVLGYNPHFVLSLPWDHLVYIGCHEVTHDALGHPFRLMGAHPEDRNDAFDHVVNLTLNRDPDLKAKFPTGLAEGLCDERFEGMYAEQVYAIIHPENEAKRQAKREEEERRRQAQQQTQDEKDDDPGQDSGAGEPDKDAGGDPGDDLDEETGNVGSMGDCLEAGASGEAFDEDEAGGEEVDDDDEEGGSEEEAGSTGVAGNGEEEEAADDGDPDENGAGGQEQGEEGADAEGQVAAGQETGNGDSPLDQAQLEKLQKEWQEAVMAATLAAGGEIEPGLARALGKAAECPRTFQEYVDTFTAQCLSEESSWNRPSRRHEVYMPSRCVPGMKVMVCGIDTSASISDNAIALMEKTEQRIMQDFNLRAIINVYCDDRVRGIERFEQGDEISLQNASGGGCTAFHPVLRVAKELEEAGEELAGVMYLTDLMGSVSDPEDFEQMQVLWVDITTRPKHREPPGGLGSVCCLYD